MPIYESKLVNSILEILVVKLTTLIADFYKSATIHNKNLI